VIQNRPLWHALPTLRPWWMNFYVTGVVRRRPMRVTTVVDALNAAVVVGNNRTMSR
jgi:hypothetical protein